MTQHKMQKRENQDDLSATTGSLTSSSAYMHVAVVCQQSRRKTDAHLEGVAVSGSVEPLCMGSLAERCLQMSVGFILCWTCLCGMVMMHVMASTQHA